MVAIVALAGLAVLFLAAFIATSIYFNQMANLCDEAIRQRDYNARGWGEARALLAAKDEDKTYLSRYFHQRDLPEGVP